MKIIQSITQSPVIATRNTVEKTVLVFNKKSEFVPLYCINKPVANKFSKVNLSYHTGSPYYEAYEFYNTLEDKTSFIHKYCAFQISFFSGFSDIWKDLSKLASQKRLEKLMTDESFNGNLSCSQLHNGTSTGKIFSFNCQASIGGELTEFYTNLGFLMDRVLSRILFCIVIRKEFIPVIRACIILDKEIPEEVDSQIQMLVRKDFIEGEKYSSLVQAFKKEIFNPFVQEGKEVQIRESFDDLFINLQRPQAKSIKESKELFVKKSESLTEALREKYKIKSLVKKAEEDKLAMEAASLFA